ncbi:MAG: hypothetical protein KY455_09665 [Euryarchaeota archaeon]|nr:hypothetical protein [Euryarchaeota archaeon]
MKLLAIIITLTMLGATGLAAVVVVPTFTEDTPSDLATTETSSLGDGSDTLQVPLSGPTSPVFDAINETFATARATACAQATTDSGLCEALTAALKKALDDEVSILEGTAHGARSADPLAVLEDAIEAGFETAANVINTAVAAYYAAGEENDLAKKGGLHFTKILKDSDGDGTNDTFLDYDGDGRADAWAIEYSLKENCQSPLPAMVKVPGIFVHQWLPPYIFDEVLPWATGAKPATDCYDEAAETDQTHQSRVTTYVTMQSQYKQYRKSFITSDYIYTPQDGTPPGAMFFDRTDATPYFGKITAAVEGNKVQLFLWTNAQDAARTKSDRSGVTEPVQFAIITIDGDTPARLVTLEILDKQITHHKPDGIVFVAPFDLSKIILMPPHDLDGDGDWNHNELTSFPLANPLNPKSVAGDADGDNCYNNEIAAERQGHKRNETTTQDRTQTDNDCFKRPWTVSFDIVDDEPDLDGITIYDDIVITTNATRNEDEWDFNESTPPVTRVEVVRVKGAETSIHHDSATTLCTLTEEHMANISAGTIVQTCDKDTSPDADAWPDETYSIFYIVCVMYEKIGEKCAGDKARSVVKVVNMPIGTLYGYEDLPDVEPHREGVPAGDVLLRFNASHPAHDLATVSIKVTPRTCCASNGDHLSATPARTFTVPFTDDPRLVYNATNEEYELTLDTSEWPHWRDLVTNKAAFLGAKLALTLTTERGGQSLPSTHPTGSKDFVEYFNNEPPQVQPETPEILVPDPDNANRTIVFRLRYIDRDGQAPAKDGIHVTVDEGDGIVVDDCKPEERAPSGAELVTGVKYNPGDRIWRCSWNAGPRAGTIDWSATVRDPDGGVNSTTITGLNLTIADAAPVLSDVSSEVYAAGTSGPTSVNMTVSVHYVDDSDAPAWIRATLTNAEHGTRVLSMPRCPIERMPPESVQEDENPLRDTTADAYHCAGVTLPELTVWNVQIDAEDVRGSTATYAASEPIKVPEACDHCMDNTGLFAPGGEAFEEGVNALNPALALVSPPFRPGDDIDDPTGIFGSIPTYVDDNPRNYIPDLIDGIVQSDIYTVNADGSIQLKDSWKISVMQTHDAGTIREKECSEALNTCAPKIELPRFEALKIEINKNDAFYGLSVCFIRTCYIQDRDLRTLDFRTTPQGFVIGFETTNHLKQGTKFAGRIELDATRLGAPGEGAGTVFQVALIGAGNDLWVNVTSNPVNAYFGANGIFADEGFDGRDLYGWALMDRETQQKVADQPVYKGSENPDGQSYKACIIGVCFDVPYALLPQLGIERNAQGEFSVCLDLNVKEAGGKQCQKQPDGLPGPDDIPKNPDEAFCQGDGEPLIGSCEDGTWKRPEPSTDPDELLEPVHGVICQYVENPHVAEDGRCEDGRYIPPGGV